MMGKKHALAWDRKNPQGVASVNDNAPSLPAKYKERPNKKKITIEEVEALISLFRGPNRFRPNKTLTSDKNDAKRR